MLHDFYLYKSHIKHIKGKRLWTLHEQISLVRITRTFKTEKTFFDLYFGNQHYDVSAAMINNLIGALPCSACTGSEDFPSKRLSLKGAWAKNIHNPGFLIEKTLHRKRLQKGTI